MFYGPQNKHGPRFWKVFRSLESLTVDQAQAQAQDCLLINGRMFGLKHLSVQLLLVAGKRDGWSAAKSWLYSPNLKSAKYICSRASSVGEDEFHEMVLDIKATIAAVETGRNYYALPPDNDYHDAHDSHDAHDVYEEEADDDDNGQDGHEEVEAEDEEDEEEDNHKFDYKEDDVKSNRGLIPGKNLQSVKTDSSIQDEDLGYFINNMDTLRKLCVPRVSLGTPTLDALGRHHRTIVELNLKCEPINTTLVLDTLKTLTELKVLTLDLVDVAAFVQSEPWACLGLKRLSIAFQDLDFSESAELAAKSRAIWQRLSCTTRLEHLDTLERGLYVQRVPPSFTHECGYGQLSSLTELRRVVVDREVLAATETDWMIGAWRKLKVLYFRAYRMEFRLADKQVARASMGRGVTVEGVFARRLDSYCEHLFNECGSKNLFEGVHRMTYSIKPGGALRE